MKKMPKKLTRWSNKLNILLAAKETITTALKDIGAFSFLELNKGIIQMQVTIKLTR